ncbi:pimeloyl-ACP methyl ester carboxylesterase [Kibdelosporangium banguiense]|uniref:Pimeloyl-ACP methyl ester carboxylesterase n=1 Tax=Kibdelosporangium banguiense TaxID=1365924 RepID=A0ABS4TEW4_9PSEU|nr:alpha/beta fold hydrolase [Kibdelosporangium banguiense]MBP2322949.1 pimeloyl-ACP methyl ester carboxylesterase [Kibdelosporangium banguiense]
MASSVLDRGETITPLRIPTAAGTFDAVAAGPCNGRKVLLLHGFPQSGIAWKGQLQALARAGYRAVAPDQRGYSPDVRPLAVEDYWLDYAVDDVVAMADALGWYRFDLVGQDWGAAVGWIAAARYTHRVRTLATVSLPRPGPQPIPEDSQALESALNWYRANDFLGYGHRVTVPTLFIADNAPDWVTGPYQWEQFSPGISELLLSHLGRF